MTTLLTKLVKQPDGRFVENEGTVFDLINPLVPKASAEASITCLVVDYLLLKLLLD